MSRELRIVFRLDAGGDSSDLMETAVFLASHASDYVNGVAIGVDGGFFATSISTEPLIPEKALIEETGKESIIMKLEWFHDDGAARQRNPYK